jgi:hypothetical protein
LWNSKVDNSVHRKPSLGYVGRWMQFTLRTPIPERHFSVISVKRRSSLEFIVHF